MRTGNPVRRPRAKQHRSQRDPPDWVDWYVVLSVTTESLSANRLEDEMDAESLRRQLAIYLGDGKYRKFVVGLRRYEQLRFWQEREWERFTAATG